MGEDDLRQLEQDGLPCTEIERETALLDVLVECGLARSRRIARDLVASGAVSANNAVQSAGDDPLDLQLALHGIYFVIRRGKKNFHLAKLV